jgi:fatty-acyl-CoA synthase
VFKGHLQSSKQTGIWVAGNWFNTGDLGVWMPMAIFG